MPSCIHRFTAVSIVNPPRPVRERPRPSAQELANRSLLVRGTRHAMLQGQGACLKARNGALDARGSAA